MLWHRELAKKFLNDSTLTDFWDIVKEAKITTLDMEILDAVFIDGKSMVQVSMEQGYSVEKVKTTLQRGYDKVYRVLKKHNKL